MNFPDFFSRDLKKMHANCIYSIVHITENRRICETTGIEMTPLLHTRFNLICKRHCHKTQCRPAGSHSGREQGRITDPKDPKHLAVLRRASIAALPMFTQARLPGCNAAPHLRLAQHCCSRQRWQLDTRKKAKYPLYFHVKKQPQHD